MATTSTKVEDENTNIADGGRYLIVRPDKGSIKDLLLGDVSKFLEIGDNNNNGNHVNGCCEDGAGVTGVGDDMKWKWVIFVSIVVRKLVAMFGKPLEFTGYLIDFLLNLVMLNGGGLFSLLLNFLRGKVVIPKRGTENFISSIGHLDGRIKLLYNSNDGIPISEHRVLMDLCIMSSKLSYENPVVVSYVVQNYWKMHFVDFYNCWNDFQKESSTQVFITCDKPKDANLIVISFRGTEPFDADDWCTDFDYSWYEIPQLGKVHMGFLEALGLGNRANVATFEYHLLQGKNPNARLFDDESRQIVPPEMVERTAYYAVRRKLKSLLKEHKNAKFIVTGHSLGGALAILFTTVLVLHKEMEVMKRLLAVYTFGQPRIGNEQLGKFMEAYLDHPVPKYFRVVYCNDLVPRLPYDDKTFLYKHFGECIYYNSLYMEQELDEEPNRNYFGLRYLIPQYANAMWELIRSLTMGYTYGPDYTESWFRILLRILGLVLPGISAHCPTDYVNSVRLGGDRATLVVSH